MSQLARRLLTGQLGLVSVGSSGYFFVQKVWPQCGHSSSAPPAPHQVPVVVLPVLRYAETFTGSPQLSHGLVVILCHQLGSHFNMTSRYDSLHRRVNPGCDRLVMVGFPVRPWPTTPAA